MALAVSFSVTESLRSVLNEFPSDTSKEENSIIHLAGDSDQRYGKIPTDQIYKETMLSRVNFLNSYKIKTLENSVRLQNKQHDVYLLTRDSIRRNTGKYDFLHIGLVQAFVRPFHQRGIDVKILVCLRDAKFPNFKDSILAAFELSLYDGATKFNWFPNFSSSLSDLANSNGLVITVEPHGYDLDKEREDSYMFGITYRMCYKLMKGTLKPKSRFKNPILEVNAQKTKFIKPKPISRN